MTSPKSAKTVVPKKKSKPELPVPSAQEQQELQEKTNQIREWRAEAQLELAKLFLQKEQLDIALRRLKEVVSEYSGSAAATEARTLMKQLENRTAAMGKLPSITC